MKKEIVYLMIMFLFAAGSASSFLLLIPFLVTHLHFSLTQAGIIGGAFSFARIFSSIPLTALAAKTGSLPMIFLATAVYALGFLFMSSSHQFLAFVLIFLITGVSISIFQPLIFGLATRLSEKEHLGNVMGFVTSGSDLGRIAVAGVISFLATQLGWQRAALIAGIAISVFLAIAFLKRPVIQEVNQDKRTHPIDETKALLKNIPFLLTSLLVFFDTMASATLFVYIPFLMFYRHFPLTIMPVLITVFFIGSLSGKLYLGKLTDKFKNTIVFITCEALMAIFLIVIANVTILPLFALFTFVLGVLTKGTVPASLTMAAESVEESKNVEHAYAFNYVILSIANTITPILVGFVADHANIVVSFYLCATAACLATIPAFLFHKRREKKLAEELLAVEKVAI